MADYSASPSERRPRIKSDDVQSLDSWSDLAIENVENGPSHCLSNGGFRKTDMILSPSRLATIQEPPESKITFVKLAKSQNDKSTTARSLLFKIPHVEKTDSHAQMQEKKHRRRKCTEQKSKVQTDISEMAETSHLQVTETFCDCRNCEEPSTNISPVHHVNDVYSSPLNKNSVLSKPRYLKNSAQTSPGNNILSKRRKSKELENEVEQSEKVKNKILSVWNNVKYGKDRMLFFNI